MSAFFCATCSHSLDVHDDKGCGSARCQCERFAWWYDANALRARLVQVERERDALVMRVGAASTEAERWALETEQRVREVAQERDDARAALRIVAAELAEYALKDACGEQDPPVRLAEILSAGMAEWDAWDGEGDERDFDLSEFLAVRVVRAVLAGGDTQ